MTMLTFVGTLNRARAVHNVIDAGRDGTLLVLWAMGKPHNIHMLQAHDVLDYVYVLRADRFASVIPFVR